MDKNKFQILSSAKLSFKAEFSKKGGQVYHFGTERTKYGITTVLTDFLPYPSAKLRLSDLLTHIKKFGTTDGTCSLVISIQLDDMNICNINKCKFILSFDEEMSYRAFPKRRNKVGAKSIKSFVTMSGINDIYDEISRFSGEGYGVDFSKIQDNIISYSYAGGEGYENKFVEISTLIDYYILHLYNTLSVPAYTVEEVALLKEIAKKSAEANAAFESYDNFIKKYPKAEILVDMYSIENTVSVFWTVISDKLRKIFLCGGINEDTPVKFNYDSDSGAYQIKDTKFDGNVLLSNMDIIDCEVSGNFDSCDFYDCDIEDSILNLCSVLGATKLKRSTANSVFFSDDSVCTDCRIFGDSIITGKCVRCVIGEDSHVKEDAKIKDSVNNSTK